MLRFPVPAAAVAALALAAAGCGGDDPAEPKDDAESSEVLTAEEVEPCVQESGETTAPQNEEGMYYDLAQEAENGAFYAQPSNIHFFFFDEQRDPQELLGRLRDLEAAYPNGEAFAATFNYETAKNVLVVYTNFMPDGSAPADDQKLVAKCLGEAGTTLPGT